jgi:hypothetical protein
MNAWCDLQTAAFTAHRISNQVGLLELAAEGAIADGDNEHAPKFRDAALAIVGQLDNLQAELDRIADVWRDEWRAMKKTVQVVA